MDFSIIRFKCYFVENFEEFQFRQEGLGIEDFKGKGGQDEVVWYMKYQGWFGVG